MRPKVANDRPKLCSKSREDERDCVSGDAKLGVEICDAEASVPWDHQDDLPIFKGWGSSHQVACNLLQREFLPKNASAHEGHLHNVAVIKAEGGLNPIPNVCS